ncbi:ABC transporter permease [Fulvivirga kasyanovii]|uniref:ABC transporter permease n=1 Tax=Fulvivirga kasyanovii TaxID=396812 RepID=A0ABW9RSE6_9BACT|nr:ABC transporter permease [Fulvivirga kasyanovii]MTI26785.1 ABC transporter permease [Fulvivirga kasyanovii]
MIKNYLKITFRNIMRNKLFAAINILGLSVSLACCLLLFLYTSEQLSYDEHHGKRLVRMTSHLTQKSGESLNLGSSSMPIAPVIESEIPEIKNSIRILIPTLFGSKDLISYEDEAFYIDGGVVTEPDFFEVLKYKFIRGSAEQTFPHNNAVVLDREIAERIFGRDNPMGKMIKLNSLTGSQDYEVTGVFDNDSYPSHLKPTYVISRENALWQPFVRQFDASWVGNNLVYTYLELDERADIGTVEGKIHEIFIKNGGAEMKELGFSKEMHLQPIEDVHTSTGLEADSLQGKSLVFIQVLMTIGVLILILACVNYINLATAQAGNRAMEVGVRKVMGVTSKGLIIQFLGESFIIVFISLLFSILFAEMALPFFNYLVGDQIILSAENMWVIGKYLLMFLLVTGLLAGLYPAFYLASFKPAQVLKGKNKDKGVAALLRKGLVIFQFVISIALISSIIVISQQVDFIKSKDLGFDKNLKMVIPLSTDEAAASYAVLKQKFAKNSMIDNVTGAHTIPGSHILSDILAYKKGQTMDDALRIIRNPVEHDYFQLFDIQLLAGAYFDGPEKDTLVSKVIINKTAADRFGYTPEEAIGEILYFDFGTMNFQYRIVGVVYDIHQLSLHDEIYPMMFQLSDGKSTQNMVLDVNSGNYQQLLSSLESDWKQILPNTPFEYFTLEDHLDKQYASDKNTFDLIKYFAAISVIISCLGLYALSMFFAERRFKEIGVRKALGAEVKDILIMVSGDLSKLILIAFILSIPISIYGMDRWLETFAYRITPGVGTYLLAGCISIFIGWLTISYQSLRAARTNPVNVLKDE